MKSFIAGSVTFWLVLIAANGAFGGERAAKDYAPFPNPDDDYVTDLAGLLSYEEEQQL